jgi:hypothetical protein
MLYCEKQKLYDAFLQQWGDRLQIIPYILRYLSYYPAIWPHKNIVNLIDAHTIHASQFQWVALVAQFDHPVETSFFYNYWVPLQTDDYDYFIDLSSDEFTVFQTYYFPGEPYCWYKRFIIKDIPELLLLIDNPAFNLERYHQRNKDASHAYLDHLLHQRDELGLDGQVNPTILEKDNLFDDNLKRSRCLKNNVLTLRGINTVAMGLVPWDTEIIISHFSSCATNLNNEKLQRVKTVKAFVFLLEYVGFENVRSYTLSFKGDERGYARYHNHVLSIKHSDLSLLKSAREQYKYFTRL